MKGYLFYDKNVAEPILVVRRRVWCVELDDNNYHITHSELLGWHPRQGSVEAQLCDGSCKLQTTIPESIWEDAKKQIPDCR